MQIWILKDEQKSGPFHDFEVRSMISEGEISPNQLAWHEGLEAWKPIGEIELFEDAFFDSDDRPPDFPDVEGIGETVTFEYEGDINEEEEVDTRPRTPEGKLIPTLQDGIVGVYLWRRFFCRLFEYAVVIMLFYIFMVIQGNNALEELTKLKNFTVIFLSWGVFENFCIHFFGTTFGKAILGIRVESHESKNLNLAQSLVRTGMVMFMLYLATTNALFAMFMLVASIFFSKMKNALPWDIYGRSQVRALPLTKMRIASIILFLIAANIMSDAVTPEKLKEEMLNFSKQHWQEVQQQMKKE